MMKRLKVALIGNGTIARYIVEHVVDDDAISIVALICRPNSQAKASKLAAGRFDVITSVDQLSPVPDLVVDCAGHEGLAAHAPSILAAGIDVVSISTGAIADENLTDKLVRSAKAGGAKLKFLSGAIGGIDALGAGSVGELEMVTYKGRKPPLGWQGSPAEAKCNLSSLTQAFTHFTGSAREAALLYPKNANVAASVALAGLGLDRTQVELIADPEVSRNIHEVAAQGSFGKMHVKIENNPMASNPKTSVLAAMSILNELKSRTGYIGF